MTELEPTHYFQTEPCGCVTINFHAPYTPASILFDGILIVSARHCARAHFTVDHLTREDEAAFLPLFRAAWQLEQLRSLFTTIQKGAADVSLV